MCTVPRTLDKPDWGILSGLVQGFDRIAAARVPFGPGTVSLPRHSFLNKRTECLWTNTEVSEGRYYSAATLRLLVIGAEAVASQFVKVSTLRSRLLRRCHGHCSGGYGGG